MLKGHGILCGLIMFNFAMKWQDAGLGLTNQWYDIPQLAYLYNIIQQTGRKGIHWPDMDTFIQVHGEEYIFIGGRPKTAVESLKKLYLATGLRDPSQFAPDSRVRNKTIRSAASTKANARLMQSSMAVVTIYSDRYLDDGPSKISVDNLAKLLKEISPKNSQKKIEDDSQLQLVRRQWEVSRQFGALQLLAAVKEGMYAEEPLLQYNYFGMHQRCIELLRLIQKKENHKFVQYFTDAYMQNDTLISNVPILILTVASGSGTAGAQMGLHPAGVSISRMVLSCEDVLEEYLANNGETACKELKAFCKNKSLGDPKQPGVSERQYVYGTSMEDFFGPAAIAAIAAIATGVGLV